MLVLWRRFSPLVFKDTHSDAHHIGTRMICSQSTPRRLTTSLKENRVERATICNKNLMLCETPCSTFPPFRETNAIIASLIKATSNNAINCPNISLILCNCFAFVVKKHNKEPCYCHSYKLYTDCRAGSCWYWVFA